jgi:hypothetical protein
VGTIGSIVILIVGWMGTLFINFVDASAHVNDASCSMRFWKPSFRI